MSEVSITRIGDNESRKLVDLLASALHADGWSPRGALELLAEIVRRKIWSDAGFRTLAEMLLTPEADGGLGLTVERAMVLADAKKFQHPDENYRRDVKGRMEDMRAEIQRAVQPEAAKPRVNHAGDNVPCSGQRGNSRQDTVRRLRRDHPELADRVLAGKLSANAAAIEAGFRKPTMTVPADTVDAAVRALVRRFSLDEVRTAIANYEEDQ